MWFSERTRRVLFWTLPPAFSLYAIFIWDGVAENYRCYSPNHEYYLIYTYSIPGWVWPTFFGRQALVKLYNSDGVELYKGTADITKTDHQAYWLGKDVFFQGSGHFFFELPTTSGLKSTLDQSCFDQPVSDALPHSMVVPGKLPAARVNAEVLVDA